MCKQIIYYYLEFDERGDLEKWDVQFFCFSISSRLLNFFSGFSGLIGLSINLLPFNCEWLCALPMTPFDFWLFAGGLGDLDFAQMLSWELLCLIFSNKVGLVSPEIIDKNKLLQNIKSVDECNKYK